MRATLACDSRSSRTAGDPPPVQRDLDMRFALGLTALCLLASPAIAQDSYDTDPPPLLEVSGGVELMSDYRFRGISRSDGDVAGKAWGELRHATGFYGGVSAYSVDGAPQFADLEFEPYAGWSGSVLPLVDLDIGVARRIYVGAPGALATDYWEPYAAVVGVLGPAKLRLGAAYAPDQDSLGSDDNLYLSADAEVGLPFSPLSFDAHVGHSDGPLSAQSLVGAGDSGTDWSAGVCYQFLPMLSAKLEYVGNDAPGIDGLTDDTVVGSVTFRF